MLADMLAMLASFATFAGYARKINRRPKLSLMIAVKQVQSHIKNLILGLIKIIT